MMLTPADFGLAAILGCEPVIENGKDGTLLGLVPEGEFLAGGRELTRVAASRSLFVCLRIILHCIR